MAASLQWVQSLRTVFQAATEPHPSIKSPTEIHSIRLFAALMLVLALLIVVFTIIPFLPEFFSPDSEWFGPDLLATGIVVLLVTSSWWSRRGHVQVTNYLVSSTFLLAIVVFAYPDMGLWELNFINWAVLPLMLASMFAPLAFSALLLFFLTLGSALIAYLTPEASFIEIATGPLAFVIVTFALQVVAVLYFRRLAAERASQEVETERLRMALENEREINHLKDHLMATISHEFKTPLAAIYTASEMIENYNDRLPAERRMELLHRIQSQVNGLSDLVSEVALMRRMQGGTFPLERQMHNLRAFCEELVRDYETFNAPDHDYTLNYTLSDDEVCVDMRLLRPIVGNLLSNAVKYSRSGSPIRLEMSRVDHWLLVTVEDQGVGIKLTDQTRIFEPFFRGENAPLATGTGLGLKIVQDCVALYGGEINFTSQEGIGTRFAVRLPLSAA
ncbi:MAG: HAMP domain-containing histidine kinase [Chloroflexi bacterium]|uniref:sensor histidine kinase n=1 Tax=Candidatus Flexifilum breve TaxID=3140694 RepID=UPI003136D4B6|nr:HAMP domain-containing histidine kinase [Chloroflexota bacterium]